MNAQSSVQLRSGNAMPIFGLGTWQLTIDTAGTVAYALELGYRMIDTSSDYGTQPGIGEAIKRSKISRGSLYIVTKVEETDDAYQATKEYLSEMDLEYSDLMLIHRPPTTGAGEELWDGLIRAKKEGLTKDIGVSNYSAELSQKLIDATSEVPTVNQIEWSPFGHSGDFKNFCAKNNIVIQAYSPLTRGNRLDNKALNQMASKYHKTPAQMMLRWNIQLGTVPLPKANQKSHLEENLGIFDFEISTQDMEILSNLNEEYSSLGSLPYV
ncbi:aldo/keto reductase [Nitrosococcus halophilus Nc 4]|uniref:Aldo/keto reductase n=1 Tax=Nitrosococcus halophilus (strain Nc4) TaxID=472759 RepID=D5BZY5_NITHN|nr:aldo/keto reductase [Nitrosococcus halophilus]ADE16232.1 aldo/keto reductase [Nitrosococcus halophilus Nc 4]